MIELDYNISLDFNLPNYNHQLLKRLDNLERDSKNWKEAYLALQAKMGTTVDVAVTNAVQANNRTWHGKLLKLEDQLKTKKELECIHGDDIHVDYEYWMKVKKDLKELNFNNFGLTMSVWMMFFAWMLERAGLIPHF